MRSILSAVLAGTLLALSGPAAHAKPKKKPVEKTAKAAGATLAVSDFDKLILGKSTKADVVRELGQPNWRFIYLAAKGDVPLNPMRTIDRELPEGTHIADLDKLWVYEYWTQDTSRSYYVVLREDHVYYWIGPVGDDEKTVSDLEKRYGKGKVTVTNELTGDTHRLDGIEVAKFEKEIFLRPVGADEFNAKLVKPKK